MLKPISMSHLTKMIRWFTATPTAKLPFASIAQMRHILEKERARAERTHEEFSLISIQCRPSDDAERMWMCLAEFLRDRLRITDDAGWLDNGRLGVLLPATPADGAWKVVDDILAHIPHEFTEPICAVYTYPYDAAADSSDADEVLLGDQRTTRSMAGFFCQSLPAWKRALDIGLASIGLLLTAPLFLLISIAVKLSSRGPILFEQWRTGISGRRFRIYKFRSMVDNADAIQHQLRAQNEQDGPAFKIRNDPRVTAIGRLLRRTSLDELPQLWNILWGDMSLVGPRPLPCHEADDCRGWQRRRFDVTPGLTCIWQVEGRSRVTFDEWMRMDLRYIRRRSLSRDLTLIGRTAYSVIFRADGC